MNYMQFVLQIHRKTRDKKKFIHKWHTAKRKKKFKQKHNDK